MAQTTEYTMGMDFTAKTFAGLEESLAGELKEMGARDIQIINRGVQFRGGFRELYKANYLLRTALRILKPVGVFRVKDDEELYNKVRQIDWSAHFRIDQTFVVSANVFHSALTHSHYVALRTKDAIVDQFREKTGKRPWVAKQDADIFIDVHISHDTCTVSLDSSGVSLHRRGYRIEADKAPINEVLAAGMIKLTGWKGEKDFYDPMCGSGTIVMEAAMEAMKLPAGYYRDTYAFMKWAGFDADLWDQVKQEADGKVIETECHIYASDRSDKAVRIAWRNLKHAGLHKDIKVKNAYFDSIRPAGRGGILVFNPPYGKRLEERRDIIALYQKIGDTLKQHFSGFEAWIITGDTDTAKFIGLKPSARITLFNGPIETKFLKFEMYEGSKKDRYDEKEIKENQLRNTGGQKKSYRKMEDGERRPFRKKDGDERKSFQRRTGVGAGSSREKGDAEKKTFRKKKHGDKSNFRNNEGEKKPYRKKENGDRKVFRKDDGEKKPYRTKDYDDKKDYREKEGEKKPIRKKDQGSRKDLQPKDGGKKPIKKSPERFPDSSSRRKKPRGPEIRSLNEEKSRDRKDTDDKLSS